MVQVLDWDDGEAVALDPHAHIGNLASRKIQAFLGTIDENENYLDPVHKQNRSLSQHIIADYHGRFLIELIQNGHDAHERDRLDGEISVLLTSDEGEHGVLYVANRGRPFSDKNADAICEMGLSSKPPGEAVGNKGLGFRSVRHVTDRPEIYSRLREQRDGGTFDGYRFTFARGAELDPMLPSDKIRAMAREDIPAFYVPLWLPDTPAPVALFARQGFSTVIRLPLRDEKALGVVRDELLGLAAAQAPMLLFLRRIKSLDVRIEGLRLADDSFTLLLSREETVLGGDTGLSRVDLGDNGLFWVARAAVPETDMQAAVAEGLESGALPESWTGWTGDGEVGIAVPVDAEDTGFRGRLYTFLPMGDGAVSPLRGHLHGSFFPSSNRKSVDPAVGVNALLLDHALSLAAAVSRSLSGSASRGEIADVPAAIAARTAVDVLLWETPASLVQSERSDKRARLNLGERMAEAIARTWDVDWVGDAPFAPCLGDWGGDPLQRPEGGPVAWRVPTAARDAPKPTQTFSLDVLARHGQPLEVAVYWPGLGQRRTDALIAFVSDQVGHHDSDLTSGERAGIAEGVARALAKAKRPDWKRWVAYYRDLPTFMNGQPTALAGREVLFCQDEKLRAGRSIAEAPGGEGKRRRRRGGEETAVFVPPPRRSEAEDAIGDDFYPPAPLREFFAFLHDDLTWHDDLAPARQFLEPVLAQPFESEALLARISQICERDETKKVRIAGLRWAFAIWRRSIVIKRPVALSTAYRLWVPTLDGEMIRAVDAAFSSGWPAHTHGRRLQQFLEAAPPTNDLADVRKRRLAEPSSSAFGSKYVDHWTTFLDGVGVKSGLFPRSVEVETPVFADRLSSLSFLREHGLPQGLDGALRKDIQAQPGLSLALPSATRYQVADPVWWMPGQADLASFNDDALEQYAALIVAWIDRIEPNQLKMTVRHLYNYRSDSRDWPTPLAALLRSAAWVPCEEPGQDGTKRRRCTGTQVWLASNAERFPPFLRRPSYRFTRAVDRAPDAAIRALGAHAGFNRFNAPESLLDQAGFLAQQYGEGGVRRHHERELVNTYARVWKALADQSRSGTLPPSSRPPEALIVRRRGQLALEDMTGDTADQVYVRDDPDAIAAGLVEVVGDALLDLRAQDPGGIATLLEGLYGPRIRRTSSLRYVIRIKGQPLDGVPEGPRLVDECPWLRVMLAVALEALDSVEANRLPADRSGIVQILDRIELLQSAAIGFTLDDQDVTPADVRPAYAFQRTDGQPLLIVVGPEPLTWSQVERALPAIGELIQHAAIVPHMKFLARQLAIDGEPIDDRPVGQDDIRRLCRMLELDDHAADAARDALGERLDRQLPWLRAVIHYLGDDEALNQWTTGEIVAIEDRSALIALLAICLPTDGAVSPEELLDAIKSSLTAGELRDRLSLEFGRFNQSLLATGATPDVQAEALASQLSFYVSDHAVAIGEALRTLVAPTILTFEPDPRYRSLKAALSSLSPDPEWILAYERVPETLLADRITAWLAQAGAPLMGSNPHSLAEIAAVRAANAQGVRSMSQVAQPLVRAWAATHGVTPVSAWSDPAQTEAELRRLLDDAGAFDCRTWSESELLRWLERLGAWPTGMPQSLDRAELGIAETEVEAQAQKARDDRERRDQESRSVRLNGVLQDPRVVDWLALSQTLSAELPKSVLNRPIGVFANLAETTGRPRSRAGAGGGSSSGAYRGVPQEKKDMIGRLGELVVYHWLRARQPEQDIDQCWISGNGALVNGREGDDGAGYDFRIAFNQQTWFIEVKASTEDPCKFEMGETEVRKAREVARSRAAERYVIVYVSNVGQSGQTRIEVLPNPFGPDADGRLWIDGDSIRYGFRRSG